MRFHPGCPRSFRPFQAAIAVCVTCTLMFLAGCTTCETADCIPRGTVFGGGGVWLAIEMSDGEILELESTGIGGSLLGDGQVGDFEYDATTMGESSAFLWSFPERSTVEAHFEWPDLDEPGEGACAAAADELALILEFPTHGLGGPDSYEVVSRVLSAADQLLVESAVDLPLAAGSHASPRHGEVETTTEYFPHLVDCLGGPSAVDGSAALTIRWDFDDETYVDLCRPLGCD